MSLRTRFTIAAVAVVAMVVVGLSIAIDLAYSARLRGDIDTRLDQLTQVVSSDLGSGGSNSAGLRSLLATPAGGAVAGVAIITSDGSRASQLSAPAKTLHLTIPTASWSTNTTPQYIDATGTKPNGGTTTFRFEVVGLGSPINIGNGITANAVAIGVTQDTVDNSVRELTLIVAIGGLVALLVAAAAGWLIARTAIKPVRRLIDAVEIVASDGDLSMRVPESPGHGEIQRLSHAFNESLSRIQVMYQALEAVIVKQRRFVADASHELRTPLTTVSSCLEMVHHFPDMPVPQRAGVIDDALHEAQQMARLVDDLLTLASMDSGDRLQRAPFDWNALLEPSVVDARRLAAPRSVIIDFDPGLGTGVGDVRAIQQVLAILVDNVVKHTAETATMTIAVKRHQGDGAQPVVIQVSDDGPGVPAEMLTQIFERFVRVDASRHGEATGLGLAIAKAVAVGHGGEIVAANVEPHGLCVTITIPPLLATPDRRRAPRPKTSVPVDS